MTDIHVSRLIARPFDAVWAAAQQAERFPDVLPDLDRVTVLENDGAGTVVTKWEGTVSLGPLTRRITWTERDVWDRDARTCTFTLVSGDMKRFDGAWTFAPVAQPSAAVGDSQAGTPAPQATQVDLRVQFELGIPVLGPMVNRIVDDLMRQNCEDLLTALEKLSS